METADDQETESQAKANDENSTSTNGEESEIGEEE